MSNLGAFFFPSDVYVSIFETADHGFAICELIYNSDGKPVDLYYLKINEAFKKHTGSDDVTGYLFSEAFERAETPWLEYYDQVIKTGGPSRFEDFNVATKRWFSVNAFRLGTYGSAIFAVIFDDITGSKNDISRQKYLNGLNEIIELYGNNPEIEKHIAETALDFFKADRCFYCKIQKGQAVISYDAHGPLLPPLSGRLTPTGIELFSRRVENIKQLVIPNVQAASQLDENFKAFCMSLNVFAFIIIPVLKRNHVVGFFCLAQNHSREWTNFETKLACETAERTWAVLDRALAEKLVRLNELRLKRQKEAFQLAMNGAPLKDPLNSIASIVVEDGVRTAFYIVSSDGTRLHPVEGAGTMAAGYLTETDGFVIGEDSLSCGLAVPTGRPVLSRDVFDEPQWKPWIYLAEKYDYRGCWSFPIKTKDSKAVGTFAMYFRAAREATQYDIKLANQVTQSAALIISCYADKMERERAMLAVHESEKQLKRLVKIRDEFISIASHELKTPVTSLKAYAEIIQERLDEIGDISDRRLLSKLNGQIERLIKLITNLLDTSNISEGHLILSFREVNLNELINERIEEINITSSHKFDVQLHDIPLVTIDRERIGQVITNLLSNAIKYSPKGTVITVASFSDHEGVKVSIQDNGYGIAHNHLDKIFERFVRIKAGNWANLPGMGLGLFISSQIIQKHSGTISAQSVEGKGSTFSFTLPYNRNQRSISQTETDNIGASLNNVQAK